MSASHFPALKHLESHAWGGWRVFGAVKVGALFCLKNTFRPLCPENYAGRLR